MSQTRYARSGDVRAVMDAVGSERAALMGTSECGLVSQTVKDLVAGSGVSLEAMGERRLKGIPDVWRLYRVVPERAEVGAGPGDP